MVIAVDFDGTVVTHRYPQIGMDIKAVPVLKKIVDAGHQIVLHTMRSGKELEEAVAWFTENEIPLYGGKRKSGPEIMDSVSQSVRTNLH